MQTATLTLTQAAYAERYTLPVLRIYTKDGGEWLLRQRAIAVGSAPDNDIVLDDGAVSRVHLEIVGERRGWLVRDLDSKNGTYCAGLKLGEAILGAHAVLRLGQTELNIVALPELMEIAMAREPAFGPLVGQHPTMREIFAWASTFATSDDAVWIDGESGTGKATLAEALHRQSRRVRGPYVQLDVAAAGAHAEAALWGEWHDALAGPVLRPGALAEAAGGTLVIAEPAELSAAAQRRLAKALQSRQWEDTAGTVQPLQCRVVLVQTGHADAQLRLGALQQALLDACARPLHLPPLRVRKNDIPLLVHHFLERLQQLQPHATPPVLSWETLVQLQRYDWPGNVRELRIHLERAAQLADFAAEPAPAQHLGADQSAAAGGATLPTWTEARAVALQRFEHAYLDEVRKRSAGQVAAAAKLMGLPKRTTEWLLERDAPDTTQFSSAAEAAAR